MNISPFLRLLIHIETSPLTFTSNKCNIIFGISSIFLGVPVSTLSHNPSLVVATTCTKFPHIRNRYRHAHPVYRRLSTMPSQRPSASYAPYVMHIVARDPKRYFQMATKKRNKKKQRKVLSFHSILRLFFFFVVLSLIVYIHMRGATNGNQLTQFQRVTEM